MPKNNAEYLGGLSPIDVHGHYGAYLRPEAGAQVEEWLSLGSHGVSARAQACDIGITFVSPLAGLLPRGRADAVSANEAAHREIAGIAGLYQYVIVNPLQPETFAQARRMLREPWCVGIKIHPEEHAYPISAQGDLLFRFLTETGVPVLAHSGCPNSLPADFLPFANAFPEVRLILAHLGNGAGDHQRTDLQVRAVQASRHGNLWIDTSSSLSIMPGLIEWGVKEVGAERLLFGSDTPLYHVAMQRVRIEAADIAAQAKRLILRDNAVKLFGFDDQLEKQRPWIPKQPS
ncbi:MAG: amidohydrolase 2 [Verrucomicrobia bacterium]|nr:amidohydrolase 2 [Verrucomicrobiota bacterium]